MNDEDMPDKAPRVAVCSKHTYDIGPDVESDPLSKDYVWDKQVTRHSPINLQQQSNNVVTPDLAIQEHTSQTQNNSEIQTVNEQRCHNAKRKRQQEKHKRKLSRLRASRACPNKKNRNKRKHSSYKRRKKGKVLPVSLESDLAAELTVDDSRTEVGFTRD